MPGEIRELRYDSPGTVTKKDQTPQGGIVTPANLTRTGVLLYRRADGSIRREFRPPEEVFKADSLRTLAGAPVTIGHPLSAVRSDNWRSLSVGHVDSDARPEGKFVAATVYVQDQGAVARVDSGELKEISCGYTVTIDPTPGEYEGEKYDCIQRNIRYNHVALGPENWGRAGNEVGLKLDSIDNTYGLAFEGDYSSGMAEATEKKTDAKSGEQPAPSTTVQVVNVADYDRVCGERDALKTRCDQLEKDLKAATSAESIDKRVDSRLVLRESARAALGPEFKTDGKSDREIMLAVIAASDSTFRADGRSDDYVVGRFEAAARQASAARESAANVNKVATEAARSDAAGEDPIAAAEKRNRERSANSWRGDSGKKDK